MSHWLIGATGLAYAVVAVDQFMKGNVNGAGMWAGYAFAQVFLWRAAL
jgi:hypothetical protein